MKYKLRFYFIGCLLLLASCKHKQFEKPVWNTISLEPSIAKSPIYKALDKQKDFRTMFDVGADASRPKSSNVSYRNNRNRSITDTTFARLNNCRSYLVNDTLNINVGINSGFASDGFIIKCYERQFTVLPYYQTDAILLDDGRKPTTFKVLNQSVTLNKPAYRLGDSVYGKVSFKIIETTAGRKITHIGYGYFRAKVEKR